MSDDKIQVFLIIVKNNPMQRVASSVDLIKQWHAELEARYNAGELWRPINFVDETTEVIASYTPDAILGIIRGIVEAPEVKQSPR